MIKALESHLRQIKLLLVLAISLLALQLVPYQAVKDILGKLILFGSIILGGIYTVLLVLDAMLTSKIGNAERELERECQQLERECRQVANEKKNG